jgi:lipid-A-disaccharide synthase
MDSQNGRPTGRLYALLAAEPSGDLQAAALIEHIRRLDPGATFVGIGGRQLRNEGVELLADTSTWGTIGPFEVFSKLPRIWVANRHLRQALLERRPAVTVMIDSPAFFMRLAKFTKAHGLPTVYYFPPSAWSDSERRAQAISARVDAVVCAFERQYRTYQRAGVTAHYFGHPMVDVVKPWTREQALASLGLSEGRYLSLMPGSRLQEVRIMTPIFVEAARRLKAEFPDLTFLLPAASDAVYPRLQALTEGTGIALFNGRAQELLAVSEVAIMTSGSVSLEAAYLDCPIVLGYRFNAFDAFLGRLLQRLGLLKVPRFALPNLLLDEDAVPELFQEEVNPDRLVRLARALLKGGADRESMLSNLRRARACLGQPPVVSQVAELVTQVARPEKAIFF